jgi:subtilisin family serine protease
MMLRPLPFRRLRAALAACTLITLAAAQATPPAKLKVEKADDLPRHLYPVPEAPSKLILDEVPFTALAAAVGKDIDADLASYDIQDRTTLQSYTATRIAEAMLAGDYHRTLSLIADLRALQDKPGEKLTAAFTFEAWAQAHLSHPAPEGFAAAFQAQLLANVNAMPWDLVQDTIKQTKGSYEIRSQNLIVGQIQQALDPGALKTGTVSATVGRQLVAVRNSLVNLMPLKAEIVGALTQVVAAHVAVKPDRWSPRLVVLDPSEKATPVRIGIWDSGVDEVTFHDRVFTDKDGHHGIAFDLHSNPSPDLIFPLGDQAAHRDELYARLKGFLDLTASIDSPESADLKKYMSSLKPDQVKPTMEGLGMIADYSHGSHVTGIATAGNPFARVVIGRITFDYHMLPEVPTVEQARKDALASQATVDYFKANGVRVVNQSWGGSVKDYENALEANGAGGTPEERKKLARQCFDISTAGLLAAMKGAPEILFVVAAGNSNDNVKFDEFVPSSFQLPNMITVGAVDLAGEETSFSSFGPMVNVHANGFEVESYVPGGRRMKLSGTSMAAPQVTNLAGKLFALDPALTPEQAKALILAGCDHHGRVNLISPAKSVALLKAQLAAAK